MKDLDLGWSRARSVDLKGEHLFAASLGTDEAGDEQLLIITGASVRISDAAGQVVLDEALLRLRAEVDGDRLLLHSRPISASTFKQSPWVHLIPASSVTYLGQLIDRGPMMGPISSLGQDGRGIPDQGWRVDRLAHLVGLVVIRAAEAEHHLSVSAGRILGELDNPKELATTGQSLVDRLRRVNQEFGGQPQSWFTDEFDWGDLADRYEKASGHRNQLVHSVRPVTSDGDPGPNTHRLPRRRPLDESFYTVATQDLPELVDLWCIFDDLAHDASRLLIALLPAHGTVGSSCPDDEQASESATRVTSE